MRPRSPWLRLLAVLFTFSIVCGIALIVLVVAEQLGIDPESLQGARSVSFPTVTLFLVWVTLLALVVFAAQRVLHGRRFLDLGFRAPALRHLVIGFAAGVALPGAPLAADLMTGSMTMEWSVPAGVSTPVLVGAYCFFFLLLTVNSFGEELVFRCYPIEPFRDSPAMTVVAIVLSSLVFAAMHFLIAEFDLGRLVVMVAYGCLYSYVYVYYRSIWLLIGLHTGINFVPATFGGNWKTCGLFTLSGGSTSSFLGLLAFFAPIFAMLLFYRFRPRPEATPAGEAGSAARSSAQ